MFGIDDYRIFYGNAAANYLKSLEKQHSAEHYEDLQDVSKIVNDLEARIPKLLTEQSDKQSPAKSS